MGGVATTADGACEYASFRGRSPRASDRDCADAIFYVPLERDASAQALDQTELCAHSTAHDRFQEWVQAGVFLKLWQAGIEQFEELCGIDWDWLSMDGAMRHLPRWAGEKTGPNPTDRGKSGVKRSLRTFGHGIPIGLTIEGANRHDMKLVRPTIESIIVDRPEPSEEHPQGMCLDKGYDYEEVRAILSEFGKTRPHSPTQGRGSGDQEASWFQGTAVDGGTSTFLDEPLSSAARSLSRKNRRIIWRFFISPVA